MQPPRHQAAQARAAPHHVRVQVGVGCDACLLDRSALGAQLGDIAERVTGPAEDGTAVARPATHGLQHRLDQNQ